MFLFPMGFIFSISPWTINTPIRMCAYMTWRWKFINFNTVFDIFVCLKLSHSFQNSLKTPENEWFIFHSLYIVSLLQAHSFHIFFETHIFQKSVSCVIFHEKGQLDNMQYALLLEFLKTIDELMSRCSLCI